jgi:hypothetical protein
VNWHREEQLPSFDRPLSEEDAYQLLHNPRLGFEHDRQARSLVRAALLDPANKPLRDCLKQKVQRSYARFLEAHDPYFINMPRQGYFKPPSRNNRSIIICEMPDREVLWIPLKNLTRNLICTGRTGGAKTSWLRLLVAMILNAGGLIIVIDRKGDFLECETLCRPELNILPLKARELQIALLQPQFDVNSHINTLVAILKSHFSLHASSRLLTHSLFDLYQRNKEPRLDDWIPEIKTSRATDVRGYKEAALACIESLQKSSDGIFEYARSDCLERLTLREGCTIIDTSWLASDIASLIASILINHEFEARKRSRERRERPLFFLLDDSLAMVSGAQSFEVEGGTNPIANWAHLMRAFNMGMIVGVQNWCLISPVLKLNTENVVCVGAYDRDADELSRFMELTREQKQVLPELQPGEVVVICRGVYSKAIRGKFPEVL